MAALFGIPTGIVVAIVWIVVSTKWNRRRTSKALQEFRRNLGVDCRESDRSGLNEI